MSIGLLGDGRVKINQVTNQRRPTTRFDARLSKILGFYEYIFVDNNVFIGREIASLPDIPKLIYIHLDQLSTSSNSVDGSPSTLLAVVPAATDAKSSIYIDFARPIYKKLQVGDIHKLNLRVLDERGERVDNNTKPFVVTLDIRDA